MSKIYFCLSFLIISIFSSAQTVLDTRPFIEVTGSAEIIVQPDEIELEIVLSEHNKNQKVAATFLTLKLSEIEAKFKKVLIANNIDQSKVTLGNPASYWYYWWTYREAHMKRKRFFVKMDKDSDFLKLMKELHFDGVETVRISKSTNKRMQEYRQEVKIAAMKAAKEKATYLVESIDEKLGKVISIYEIPASNYRWLSQQKLVSNVSINSSGTADAIDNVAEIKLRYEIKAKFSIEG